MDDYRHDLSSNDVLVDETASRFEKDLGVVQPTTSIDSSSSYPDDLSFSKVSDDGLGSSSFGVISASAAKAIVNNTEYPPLKRLMLWHSLCSREYLDLYSSLGVTEATCLIHAESLIVYVCCLAHKEGHNLFEYTSGPQTIEFIYRVERFLDNFARCGGTVRLVFFEVFRDVFDPEFALTGEDSFFSGFLYYRQLLLCHCKAKNIPHLLFHNWLNDPSFSSYLSHNEPACILVEDGSSFVYIYDTVYELLDVPGSGKPNKDNAEKYGEHLMNQERVDRYCNVVYTLIAQSLTHSLSVAYLFDISRHSRDFKAFISFASNTHVNAQLHQQACALMVQLLDLNDLTIQREDPSLVTGLYGEVCAIVDSKVKMRDLVVCNYMREYQKVTEAGADAADEAIQESLRLLLLTSKCLLIHNHIADTVSLRERCTRRVEAEKWQFYTEMVADLVDIFCNASCTVFDSMRELEEAELARMERLDTDLTDVFDCNLFSTVLYLLCAHAKTHGDQVDADFMRLDEKTVRKFDAMCQHFTGNPNNTFFPIRLDGLDYAYSDDAEGDGPESADQLPNHTNHTDGSERAEHTHGPDYKKLEDMSNKYLFVNNSFVNLYYKFDRKDLNWVKAKPNDDLVMFKKHAWRDPCTISERMECIDFHLNFDAKEKQHDLTKMASRRSLQHQTTFSFLLSKYLGSSNLHHPIVIKLEHHWLHVKYANLLNYSRTLGAGAKAPGSAKSSARETSKQAKSAKAAAKEAQAKPAKEGRGQAKEKMSKADLLRMKNTEHQENKKLEADNNTLNRLEGKLTQLFNNDRSFEEIYTNILENTDGPNRPVDLIADFKWVKSILATRNVQMTYLHRMLERLHNCFSSYRLRIVNNHPNAFRKLLAVVLRLVFVFYNQYHDLMPRDAVLLLHNFLWQLNFKRYAANLVKAYNRYLETKEEGAEADRPDKKGKKGKTAERKRDEHKNAITQKDLEREQRENAQWDFAIFDDAEYNFMLCYMGDLFERTLGSCNDKRVLFRPDSWQKMLLDIVDARESALVVAPTSTGKTYICYYAMEQVLRLDDHGMVIYVSPNTALALQVTYEITARFSSKYYTNPNLALSSTFLEKFHDPKWHASQIVVTVPTILEKLLISMRNHEANFASRLEYIIFDEVHCIADVEIGTFMERCIHLIPCPFLALSATIANAMQFHAWLQKIATYNTPAGPSAVADTDELVVNNNKVHFIQFDERFSDLKLEVYSAATGAAASKPKKGLLVPFNPICCMTHTNLVANGFPKDVYLNPYDAYVFVQALLATAGRYGEGGGKRAGLLETIEYLDPENYFSGCTLVTKRQYRYYLDTLKFEFARQIQGGAIDEGTYQEVLARVNMLSSGVRASELAGKHRLYPLLKPQHLLDIMAAEHSTRSSEAAAAPQPAADSPAYAEASPESNRGSTLSSEEPAPDRLTSREDPLGLVDEEAGRLDYLDENAFYEMLKKLQSNNRLPCLVFILDRNKMDHVLVNVTKLLLRLQWERFFGTPERTLATKMANKARMDKYQMQLKQYEAEKKMKASASKEQRELEGITNNMELEMPVEPVDVSQDYDPDFYFYNRRIYVNYSDEIEKFIGIAANSISNRKNANIFIEALKRGLGIHHEGLPHKFTMLTETLLRLGFLNVIISSKSLAFGINVPCKSVLFCGDNYELTPLMYKQMSGRCGRRGFDLSGHVIFWSISRKRIKQLLLTKLQTLTTNTSNINLSILLTILSSFYTLIIKSNMGNAGVNTAFLGRKNEDYVDIREDLIANARKLMIEPKVLVQRLSSIFNNTLNLYAMPDEPGQAGTGREQHELIVVLIRSMLEILVTCGLLDMNGLIRGCYELALLTRDIHPSNILLAQLVQSEAVSGLIESNNEEAAVAKLLELLSLLIHRKKEMSNVLNVRRLVTTKVRNGTNQPNVRDALSAECDHTYQVAYPDTFPLLPYHEGLQRHIDYYNKLVLYTTSKYLATREAGAPENGPNGAPGANGAPGSFLELYRARSLYSGQPAPATMANDRINVYGAMRKIGTCHELQISSHRFDVTSDIVPTIEGSFCHIVQLDAKFNEVKRFTTTFDNSYMCDYFTHGRFSVLRDANGLGQYAWSYLKKFIVLLQHLKYVLKTYTGHLAEEDALFNSVRMLLDKLEPMFGKI